MPRTKQQKPRHYVVDEELTEGGISATSSPRSNVDVDVSDEDIKEPFDKCDTPKSETPEPPNKENERREAIHEAERNVSNFAHGHVQGNELARNQLEMEYLRSRTPFRDQSISPLSATGTRSLETSLREGTDLKEREQLLLDESEKAARAMTEADGRFLPGDFVRTDARYGVPHQGNWSNGLDPASQYSPRSFGNSGKGSQSDFNLAGMMARDTLSGVAALDRAQHHPLSAAAAQYMETLKRLYDGAAPLRDEPKAPGMDFWSTWTNAARRPTYTDFATKEQEELFYSYLSQLSGRWNAMMAQQFGKGGEGYGYKQDPFFGAAPQIQREMESSSRARHLTEDANRDRSPEPRDSGNSFEHQRRPPRATRAPTVSISGPTDVCIDFSGRDKLTTASDTARLTNSATATRRPPSPINIPDGSSQLNVAAAALDSPHSAPANTQEHLSPWQSSLVPVRTLQRWSSSPWSGYSSPSHPYSSPTFQYPSPRPDAKRFSPSMKSKGYADDGPNKPKFDTADIMETSSLSIPSPLSSEKSDTKYSPTSLDKVNLQQSNRSPTLVSAAQSCAYETRNNQLLNDVRGRHGMPYPSLASQSWLNSPPSAGGILPSTLCSLPSYPTSSGSSLFFPSRVPLLADSFQSTHHHPSYLLDAADASPGTKSGGTRRIRSRGPPIDSVHAAIVREAKEQFKGLDPENMYIQCPICQKRIKRLYHFQRHMRIHTGEKTHHCPCCQYKSVRKDNLKSHMKTHEKQNMENGRQAGRTTYQSVRDPSDRSRIHTETRSVPSSAAKPQLPKSRPSLPASAKLGVPGTPAWKGSSDYKASFSSCTPQYPFPYFSSQYPSYMSISQLPASTATATNVEPSEHDTPNLRDESTFSSPRSEKSKMPTVEGASSEDRENADKETSPIATSDTKVEAVCDVSDGQTTLKRHIEDCEPQDMSCKVTDKASSPKRPKPDHPCQSPHQAHEELEERNANHNNSNKSWQPYYPDSNLGGAMSAFVKVEEPPTSTASNSPESSPDPLLPKVTRDGKPVETPENRGAEIQRFDTAASSALAEIAAVAASRREGASLSEPEQEGNDSDTEKRVHRPSSSSSSSLFSIASPNATSETSNSSSGGLCEGTPVIRFSSVIKSVPESHRVPSSYAINGIVDARRLFSDPSKLPFPRDVVGGPERTEAPLPTSHPSNHSGEGGQRSESEKLSPNSAVGAAKELTCRLCRFRSASSGELQSHVSVVHKQDGFYKCDECNYLGKNLSKLVEHIRIHTGERPFKCDQCNYAAKRKDNLAQHKAVRHDKRKGKSNIYSVLDNASEQAQVHGVRQRISGRKAPPNGVQQDYSKPFSFADFHANSKTQATINGVAMPEIDKLLSSTIAMTPLFHSFSPVHSIPAFPYPLCAPSPLLHSPSGLGALNAAHARAVSERPANPGSYSLKVRAALISP